MIGQDLNRYWKTVVDTIQEGVMIVDESETIVSVNKALEKMTSYTREEMVGKHCSIISCNGCGAPGEKKEGEKCYLFRRGVVNMVRCVLKRKDGSHVHILKNASCLRGFDDRVIGAVETMTDITELIQKDTQIEVFRRELQGENNFHGIIGGCASMERLFDLISNAAQSHAPIIIFGESGTGKELVAKAIHEIGARRSKPFVKVNCSALSESLLESELFGHVKGAFTGAYRDRIGRFESAKGGDIFLDEVGDLPFATQIKLLRVLEEKVIERVGDNKPVHINVRVISATNKDLRTLVEQDSFREDLFYRINAIPITIPPLRERVEDIPLIADHFFRRIQLKSDKRIEDISKEAMELLMKYHWPGNVRELKSALEYAFVCCQGSVIQPYHFPPNILQWKRSSKVSKNASVDRAEIQRQRLIQVLEQAGGNQSKAAQLLGISRVTVWNRMKRFGIKSQRNIDA